MLPICQKLLGGVAVIFGALMGLALAPGVAHGATAGALSLETAQARAR